MKLGPIVIVMVISLVFGLYMGLFQSYQEYHKLENDGLRLLSITKSLNESLMKENPYRVNQTEEMMKRDGYCAVKFVPGTLNYYMKNYETPEAAAKDGAQITHKNKCGACSTLKDLAVYIHNTDLTRPVRKCATLAFSKAIFDNCMERLGFTPDCGDIWYYNSVNTIENCFTTCVASWLRGEKLNKPDGALNDCIQCDEDISGPNFKRYAGRTRRNSGIAAEIDRNTEEIYLMNHTYLGLTLKF